MRKLTAMVTSQKPLPSSVFRIQILIFEPSNPFLKFTFSISSFFNSPSFFVSGRNLNWDVIQNRKKIEWSFSSSNRLKWRQGVLPSWSSTLCFSASSLSHGVVSKPLKHRYLHQHLFSLWNQLFQFRGFD